MEVFRSCLAERKQVEGSISNRRTSNLAYPVLLNIYMNSLTLLKINGRIASYADDTVAIFRDKTWDEKEFWQKSLIEEGGTDVK